MTVSVPTDKNGFFDPLQISVYDKDDIQIDTNVVWAWRD